MYSSHGALAATALLLWLPVTAVLFAWLSPARAGIASVLGALMFLPELAWFDLPLMPDLGKDNLPYLYIFSLCIIRCPKRLLSRGPGLWFFVVVLTLFVSNVATALTNTDTLTYGSWITTVVPGLDIKDGLAIAVGSVLEIALPLYLGAVLFKSSEELRVLLRGLVIAGLLYSLFMLVEIRLSPQLHRWVYGYTQHLRFSQVMRWGGYRPMVFMAHGLAIGLFALVTAMAATTLSKARVRIRGLPPTMLALYLAVILVLCKSTASIIYGLCLLPLVWFFSPRMQVRVAILMAFMVFLYPLLWATDLLPVQRILSLAAEISLERQQSLAFRFENEQMLLDKALERPWFGWGTYGRNAIYDSLMGKQISITDGYWIILVGIQGVIGFVCAFTLLLFPVFTAARHLGKIDTPANRTLLAGLTVIVGITAIDLLPNGLFSSYPYFLSGALLGTARGMRRESEERP